MLDKQALAQEVSVGVTYSSLMSAVSLFFTGVLISQYNSLSVTVKVPLIFLIISTFSFIFSATVYNNAGSEITLNKLRVVEKYMIYGKNIMELMGLYPFVLATPLVIGAVTRDSFLRTTTILVAVTGFALYSQSKFSILEKELPRTTKRLVTVTIVALTLALYYFQTSSHENALQIYSGLAIGLLTMIFSLAYHFSTNSKQYKPTFFRPFEARDAEELSSIIIGNLKHRKALGQAAFSQQQQDKYSADGLLKLAEERDIIVAEFNGRVVGLGAISDNTISTIFTASSVHRKGIGRMLVEYIENIAVQRGEHQVQVLAGKVDHDFYKRLGYEDVSNAPPSDDGRKLMSKSLHAT